MSEPKLRKTTDYEKFNHIKNNRPVNLRRTNVRKLKRSMRKHGWLPSQPMKIRKNGDGKYYIDDGQHRLAIAEEFGLTVYYVVDNANIDLAEFQGTSSTWSLEDYLHKYVSEGIDDYIYLEHFYNRYDIPLSVCVSLLEGVSYFYGDKFKDGSFEIKDKQTANDIAKAVLKIRELQDRARGRRFIESLILCSKVDGFDLSTFVSKCESHTDKLQNCGDVEAYLSVIEETYNFKSRDKIPLKFLAKEVKRKET